MACNCKNKKKPLPQEVIEDIEKNHIIEPVTPTDEEIDEFIKTKSFVLTKEEIEWFNNIDVIDPLKDEDNE